MAHVFRFHEGNESLDGWEFSNQYDAKSIAAIKDPAGGSAALPITSIPSPFAGFELVRSAFGEVTKNEAVGLQGATIYHKLVSFALDVMEIFFNFKMFRDHYEIIQWTRRDLQHLLDNPAFAQLGATLNLFMTQDAEGFHFNKIDAIYLLNYKDGPDPVNIVGATSPTSVCVSSPNDLSYVETYLTNHRAFDANPKNFKALYERSDDFIRYLWLLCRQPHFREVFVEVNDYVQACFAHISRSDLKESLRASAPEDYAANYKYLQLGANNRVYLLSDLSLRIKPDAAGYIAAHSDFRILSSSAHHSDTAFQPLVLPISLFNDAELFYTSGPWLHGNMAKPFSSEPDLNKRELPFDGTVYPYLTPDDLFEPYLIRTPFPINADCFFTGFSEKADVGFLLPLKRRLFDYLDLSDVFGLTTEVHPHRIFKLETLVGGSIRATLRVPIQKGRYVVYDRIYYNSVDMRPEREKNTGVVIDCAFDLYLFPWFHLSGPVSTGPQRVALIDEDTKAATLHREYQLSFFRRDGIRCEVDHSVLRADKQHDDPLTTRYEVLREDYDFIEVSVGDACGLVMPHWREVLSGGKRVEVAVDFGTTNTHIEYKMDGRIVPFEISGSEVLSMPLHDYMNADMEHVFAERDLDYFLDIPRQEFVPLRIGGVRSVHFPTRTVMCRPRRHSASFGSIVPLADASIGFHYERYVESNHNETITNLKWTGSENANLTEAFFEELLLLLRYKILQLGGALELTSITWFYPVSMLPYQRSRLAAIWKGLAERLISPACLLHCVTESVAPYYYYKNSKGVNSSVRPAVSMDIGGETTDFVIYHANRPVALSSVRFAGNSIFGDFYGTDISKNGFVQRFEPKVLEAISADGNVKNCYEKIRRRGHSADVVSFMFSLENNPRLSDSGVSLSAWLSQDYSMKFVLLLFEVAQLYYLSSMLKAQGMHTPAYLTLSGMASRNLSLLGEDDNLQLLTRCVFNTLLHDDGEVELCRVDNPKVITCKGGLDLRPEDVQIDADSLKYVYSGSSTFDASSHAFSEVNETVQNEVLRSYRTFVDFFFDLDAQLPFQKYFGIPTRRMDAYRDILLHKSAQYLGTVIEERAREAAGEQNPKVEDSLFFYPLMGAVNQLAYEISQEK